jgi:hypothetical protein
MPTDVARVMAEIAAGLGLSLPQAARRLPSTRQGRPVSPSCIYRWTAQGVRLPSGEVVRLEAARLSGRWLTSAPALERFLAAQTPQLDAPAAPAPRSPAQRRRASERAAAELERLGI